MLGEVMRKYFFFLSFISIQLLAHGTEKAGPNGGNIQMPGPFHTELKVEGKRLKIWLLDMNFEKPLVDKSSVDVSIKQGEKVERLKCQIQSELFTCPFKSVLTKGTEIAVEAKRSGAIGGPAIYTYPLEY